MNSGGTKSSSRSRPKQHHGDLEPQRQAQHDQYETPPGVAHLRQTPPSARYYDDRVSSVARQEQFQRQQAEALPQHFGIGLDYVQDEWTMEHKSGRSPLVLDPSAPTPPSASSNSTSIHPKAGMVNSLLRGMGVSGSSPASAPSSLSPSRNHYHRSGNKQRSPIVRNAQQRHLLKVQPPPPSLQPPTATEFARRAAKAGFLQKLGSNLPTYKRRFFVLQPSTQLYYFLSPQDNFPRGSIAIDDARLSQLEELPDGRTRFHLTWPDGNTLDLEARSQEVAEEWCRFLKQERFSYVRQQLEESQQHNAHLEEELHDVRRQLEHFRFVEQDRDGALEDARRWKERFEELDEAIRLLANHVRKLPTTPSDSLPTRGEESNKGEAATDTEIPAVLESEMGSDKTVFAKVDDNVTVGETEQGETQGSCFDKISDLGDSPEYDSTNSLKKEIERPEGENIERDISRRDISLLDDDAAAEAAAAHIFESSNIIEELNAPGQHFASLVNACQQLRENLRLASDEAATAVEDTKAAQVLAQALKTRMTKAEKQLCQLWEENCGIRKALKQKKREKRVLIREVKSLMEQQQQYLELQAEQQRNSRYKNRSSRNADEKDNSTIIGRDEERLINELEEHVASSIRLHEQVVSATGDNGRQNIEDTHSKGKIFTDSNGTPSCSSTATTTASSRSGIGLQSTTSTITTEIVKHISSKPIAPRSGGSHGAQVTSLFDGSSSESESEAGGEDSDRNPAVEGFATRSSEPTVVPTTGNTNEMGMPKPFYDETDGWSISSVAASFGADSNNSIGRSRASTPMRPNPLLQLDEDMNEGAERKPEEVDQTKCFKPINVAHRGSATSRLVCPLADVVKSNPTTSGGKQLPLQPSTKSHPDDLQIYHVTFYTRKIGLQFQKVPAPPTKARGLLTAALTADLAEDPHGSSKTAAELRRIAEISRWARSGHDSPDNHSCLQVATPDDAVLVCGFEGFDDSGNNIRPRLGARLVAFDGVSVEVGKWTFESIRKAIQARGRPLTLSFRNDFLTTDQRAIMTKSTGWLDQEYATKMAPPGGFSYQSDEHHLGDSCHADHPRFVEARPPSSGPSLHSAPSHETEHFVNETTIRMSNSANLRDLVDRPQKLAEEEDDLTVSTTGYYSDMYHHHYHPPPNSQPRRFTASSGGSYSSSRHSGGHQNDFKSFSEVGSSASALSSAIGPLMSNIMSTLSAEKKQVNMTPDYLRRREAIETTPQHQDFQSNLL